MDHMHTHAVYETLRGDLKEPTTIFKGPCIFSWAAKAFLKGVGVLGVWTIIDLRTFGVLKLIKAKSVYTSVVWCRILDSDWSEGFWHVNSGIYIL